MTLYKETDALKRRISGRPLGGLRTDHSEPYTYLVSLGFPGFRGIGRESVCDEAEVELMMTDWMSNEGYRGHADEPFRERGNPPRIDHSVGVITQNYQ